MFSVTNLVRRGVFFGLSTMRPSFLSAEEFVGSIGRILPDVEVSKPRYASRPWRSISKRARRSCCATGA